MLTFCTLFDSNYLDKGLVLYESMTKVMGNFKLYILAMDEKCEEILKSMNLSNIIVISLKEFEDNELLEIKTKRARAEYCWTCTASLIDYVLKNYNETYCTYVDSDLYFYENPQILIGEMDWVIFVIFNLQLLMNLVMYWAYLMHMNLFPKHGLCMVMEQTMIYQEEASKLQILTF